MRSLCFPRVLGYVFNPLSVWFCHGPDGDLRAILYEVSNTFGETHHYLVPVRPGDDRTVIRTEFDKELFVSPFVDMAASYDFRTRIPDERIAVLVRERVAGGQVLVATLTRAAAGAHRTAADMDAAALSTRDAPRDPGHPRARVASLAEGRTVPAPRNASGARRHGDRGLARSGRLVRA